MKENKKNINWYDFIIPLKKKANYRTSSPYGIITPAFILVLKNGNSIQLPKNHNSFIDFLNEKQPQTIKELNELELEFCKKYFEK